MNILYQTERHVRKLPRKILHKKVHGKRWRTNCIKDKEIHFTQLLEAKSIFSGMCWMPKEVRDGLPTRNNCIFTMFVIMAS